MAKVWDALRFVFLMRASGPEHRNQSIADVSRSPSASCWSSPGNRTSAFGVWSSNQGMDQLGEGDGARSAGRCPLAVYGPISVRYRAGERWGRDVLGRQDVEMRGVGLRTGGVGHRSVGSQHGTWGLRRWMTSCSTIAFIPAFTPVSTPTPKWRCCSWRAMRWPA